ncbi:MAG: hypothetical protein H0V81_16625 [Solirubrobacterales bacterium]|nr:hypothetical protein [Solirubrobacterales bacterium]
MTPAARIGLLASLLLLGLLAIRGGQGPQSPPTASAFASPTAESRARGLRFEGVTPGDQQAVLAAIGRSRPEAQRLFDAVSGLIVVRVGPLGRGEAGSSTSSSAGYDVQLDVAGVTAALGARGVERLVLHELGHVVDAALVPDALKTSLDAGIPAGYGCEDGVTGSCAIREERFAESFAKWAMDDIGLNLDLGYKVLPPAQPLAVWGAPLAALGG